MIDLTYVIFDWGITAKALWASSPALSLLCGISAAFFSGAKREDTVVIATLP